MLTVMSIPALKDNYIWCLIHSKTRQAVVVDPGDATPVLKFLAEQHLQLAAILITHHHWDHTKGIVELANKFPVVVYGSSKAVQGVTAIVHENKSFTLFEQFQFNVITIPGHTLDHVAYYGHGMLFCGDTLFTAGCGRVFEGTVEQMHHSLQKLAALPNETLIYCGHEYTLQNLLFAKTVEPDNQEIIKRFEQVKKMREQNLPTVPATLAIEKQTNVFLKANFNDFQRLRQQKDTFT